MGPMFAGKSTEMIRRVRCYEHANLCALVVKYAGDHRYADRSQIDHVSTHDTPNAIPALRAASLMDVAANQTAFDGADVVGIDEGQFFPDLVRFCDHAANLDKVVVVAMLDGTFERRPFGPV